MAGRGELIGVVDGASVVDVLYENNNIFIAFYTYVSYPEMKGGE
jgi:hypothetical protein